MFKSLFKKKTEETINTVQDVQEKVEVETTDVVQEKTLFEQLQERIATNIENGSNNKGEVPYLEPEDINLFETLLEEKVQDFIEDDEDAEDYEDEDELYSLRLNMVQELYMELNPNYTEGEMYYLTTEYANKLRGSKTARSVTKEDITHEPVHGVTLEDYAKGSAKIAKGENFDDVCTTYGVTAEQWQDVQNIWIQRMSEEMATGNHNLSLLYAQYMSEDMTTE